MSISLKISNNINTEVYTDYAVPFQIYFQDPATANAEGIALLHNDIMFLLCFILGFVFTMIFNAVIIFDSSNYIEENFLNYSLKIFTLKSRKIQHQSVLEVLWTIIPTLILISIGIPSFYLLYALDEPVYCPVIFKVIGHQWYWEYQLTFLQWNVEENIANLHNKTDLSYDSYMKVYSDLEKGDMRLLEVDNPLAVPIFLNLKFLVTSDDVIHSFCVPSLGIKVDAMPGRINQVFTWLKRPGRYYGQCSEICGVGHGFMPIVVLALSPSCFLEWGSMFIEVRDAETY
jgi:cytochrome c oxidase subunit 2